MHVEEASAKSSTEKGSTESLSSLRNRIQDPTWLKKFQIWSLNEVNKLQISIRSRSTSGSNPTQRVVNMMRQGLDPTREVISQNEGQFGALPSREIIFSNQLEGSIEQTLNQLEEEIFASTSIGARMARTPMMQPEDTKSLSLEHPEGPLFGYQTFQRECPLRPVRKRRFEVKLESRTGEPSQRPPRAEPASTPASRIGRVGPAWFYNRFMLASQKHKAGVDLPFHVYKVEPPRGVQMKVIT